MTVTDAARPGLEAAPPALAAAIAAYLDHLRVERGLARLTLVAYASDLRLFAIGAPGIRRWASSPEPARGYLAGLARPPRPLRPASHRRKAAAIRAFYRFAFAEELIERDIAGLLDLPRPARRLPDTLDVPQVEALLAAPAQDEPRGIRDRALLELLYASGLRISEALGLDRQDLSLEGGFVRVIGKGDKERMVPVGDVALDALGRYIDEVRARMGRGRRRAGTWWPALRLGARAAPGPDGGLAHGPGRRHVRAPGRPRDPAHAASLASPRTSSRAAPTCGSSRNCSGMRVLRPPSSTPT